MVLRILLRGDLIYKSLKGSNGSTSSINFSYSQSMPGCFTDNHIIHSAQDKGNYEWVEGHPL